jgi:hypothetical protein
MSDENSILILSACTATKVSTDTDTALMAEELYAGQQHRRMMQGIFAYRRAGEPAGTLELHILSAGHGVVSAGAQLCKYDATFAGMRRAQLRRVAVRLRVPAAVSNLLAQPRKLSLLLLGEDYLQAAHLAAATTLGAPTVVFTSPGGARRLPRSQRLHLVPLDNRDARRFSCGLVGLKGELASRLLVRLVSKPSAQVPLERASLLDWLETETRACGVRPQRDDLATVA